MQPRFEYLKILDYLNILNEIISIHLTLSKENEPRSKD
jgi:hypothetical protein